jgi:hypothetical protein
VEVFAIADKDVPIWEDEGDYDEEFGEEES